MKGRFSRISNSKQAFPFHFLSPFIYHVFYFFWGEVEFGEGELVDSHFDEGVDYVLAGSD